MELQVLSKFHLELLGCYKKLYNKEVEPLVGLPGGIYLFLMIFVFTEKKPMNFFFFFSEEENDAEDDEDEWDD